MVTDRIHNKHIKTTDSTKHSTTHCNRWHARHKHTPLAQRNTSTTPAQLLITTCITNQTKVTASHTSAYKTDNTHVPRLKKQATFNNNKYTIHIKTHKKVTSTHQTKHKRHPHHNIHYLPQQQKN